MICYLFPEPTYFFFSSQVPSLLYYAQIPAILVSLIIGFYILFNGRHALLNKLFFTITLLFSLWTISTLVEWTNIHSKLIMFIWSFSGVILGLISILCIYFIYVFLQKKDISLRIKSVFLALLAPVFILMPTALNISGFNITSCDAFEFEWLPYKIYYTALSVLAIIWILILLIRHYRTATPNIKKQILLMGSGIELFIFSFFGMESVASYFTQIGILPDSSLELYGLFGIIIFIVYISILMVQFKTFNVKLIATQALVWGVGILVGSEIFFTNTVTNSILVGITFVAVIISGYFLVRSVKKEVKQKEELQKLSEQLFEANDKLKGLDKMKTEFLSLASHQFRSPLTAINGYTSMLLEGDFGPINDKQKETVDRIFESGRHLAKVIEDFLNVSKIEQGGMQYTMAVFDMEKAAKDLATDLSVTAEKKGLKLSFETDGQGPYNVNGDMEKLRQVMLNLIDNSIKYTKEGSIKVKLEKKDGKIIWSVSDTGMGIPPEIMPTLFQKFSRGEGAKMNTSGSGLGLYLAKTIVEAHKGRVWAESAGSGKGSSFLMELSAA